VRKPIVLLFLCAFLFGSAVARPAFDEAARLHPALHALVSAVGEGAWPQDLALGSSGSWGRLQSTISPTGEVRIGILVKLRESVSTHSYHGIPMLGKAGTIAVLTATVGELSTLAADPNVVYVEPSWRTRPMLDLSIPAIRADLAHGASPAVLGEGVVVGVIDTGIDYAHLDFRRDSNGDGFEETSRIHAIWDQTWGLLGAEYDRSEIENDIGFGLGPTEGLVRAADTDGHGTHVASIAAGDGSSSASGFVGVAPAATIVAVKTSFFTADIISAVQYVFDQADALGLPAVVNLSLGGHDGPHDGTSLFEEGLDQLAQGPGRAIVVSAGNEGDLRIHTSATLVGGSTSFVVQPEDWEVEVSLWYPGTSQFTITINPPSEPPIAVPSGAETGYVTTTDGTVYANNASGGVNPNNGDREAFIRLVDVGIGDRWRIEIADAGGGGRFDAWITSESGSIEGGDSTSTIDEPGNADRVITVGSFNSKSTWPSLSGNQDYSGEYPVGQLSAFSSQGPTRDGRTKPDICAPGAWICAAGSADAASFQFLANPDGQHVMEIGTSMAAPHVTGTIALLFSLDPGLAIDDVREILTATGSRDLHTGFVPNGRWGWGKLDASEAVGAVEATEPPQPPVDAEAPEIELQQNPVGASAQFVYEVPAGSSSATLRIYTVAGSLVFETTVEPVSGTYEWNLRSIRGETLAVGLYLYVLVTDHAASRVGRLVIER